MKFIQLSNLFSNCLTWRQQHFPQSVECRSCPSLSPVGETRQFNNTVLIMETVKRQHSGIEEEGLRIYVDSGERSVGLGAFRERMLRMQVPGGTGRPKKRFVDVVNHTWEVGVTEDVETRVRKWLSPGNDSKRQWNFPAPSLLFLLLSYSSTEMDPVR